MTSTRRRRVLFFIALLSALAVGAGFAGVVLRRLHIERQAIHSLSSPDVRTRREAARALVELRSVRGTRALVTAARAERVDSSWIAEAIVDIAAGATPTADSLLTASLVEWLESASGGDWAVASFVGALGEVSLPAISRALRGQSSTGRLRAIESLKWMSPIPPEAIPLVEEALAGSPQERYEALKIVASSREVAVEVRPLLTGLLGDRDRRVRFAAFRILADSGAARAAVEGLLSQLDDAEFDGVLRQRLRSLGQEGVALLPGFTAALRSSDARVRARAAWLLPDIHVLARQTAPIQSALHAALDDGDPLVRWAALRSLTRILEMLSLDRALAARLLRDASPLVRRRAAVLLALDVGRKDAGDGEERDGSASDTGGSDTRAVDVDAGVDVDEVAPLLLAALELDDPETQADAATALGRLERLPDHVAPAIVKLLASGDVGVRRAAARAAGLVGAVGGAAVPGLRDALRSGDAELERAALVALERIGPAAIAAVPELLDLLDRFQLEPWWKPASALRPGGFRVWEFDPRRPTDPLISLWLSLGDAAVPPLARSVERDAGKLGWKCLAVLSLRGDSWPAARRALERIAGEIDAPSVRQGALLTLCQRFDRLDFRKLDTGERAALSTSLRGIFGEPAIPEYELLAATALMALEGIDDAIRTVVVAALTGGDEDGTAMALLALGRAGRAWLTDGKIRTAVGAHQQGNNHLLRVQADQAVEMARAGTDDP